MSVLDQIEGGLFEEIINTLNIAIETESHKSRDQDSVIEQINKLAYELFNQEEFMPDLDKAVHSVKAESRVLQAPFEQTLELPKKSKIAASAVTEKPLQQVGNMQYSTVKRALGKALDSVANSKVRYGKLVRNETAAAIQKTVPSNYKPLVDKTKQHQAESKKRMLEGFISKQVKATTEKRQIQQNRMYASVVNDVTESKKHLDKKRQRMNNLIQEGHSIANLLQQQKSFSRSTLYQTHRSVQILQNLNRGSSIYQRSVHKLNQKQEFIARQRKKQELEQASGVTLHPSIRKNIPVEGKFQQRLASSTQRTRINKAKLVEKELAKCSFKPKLTQKPTQSKIKSLWLKKKTNPDPVFNNISADVSGFSNKTPHRTDYKSTVISIHYNQDIQFLLQ